MAPQKSEDRIVPEERRKPFPTRGPEQPGGGKAVPVKEEDRQLKLAFVPAENPLNPSGAQRVDVADRSAKKAHKVPQAKVKLGRVDPARMDRLGVPKKTAWRGVYKERKLIWALSHSPAVDRGLRNAYFAERGLVSLRARFEAIWAAAHAPKQLTLPWVSARS